LGYSKISRLIEINPVAQICWKNQIKYRYFGRLGILELFRADPLRPNQGAKNRRKGADNIELHPREIHAGAAHAVENAPGGRTGISTGDCGDVQEADANPGEDGAQGLLGAVLDFDNKR
jgi:hypothetical protein